MRRIDLLLRKTFNRVCRSREAWRAGPVLFGCLIALYGWTCAQAQAPHSATLARGEHVARLVCSACHVVASDQEFPPILEPKAPDFAEIASRPGVTAKSIRRFVLTTHWDEKTIPMTMPNLMMLPEDASAVSAYIMSLKKR